MSSTITGTITAVCSALEQTLRELFDLLQRNIEETPYQVSYSLIHGKYLECEELVRKLRGLVSEPWGDSGTIYEHMQYGWLLEQQETEQDRKSLAAERERLEQLLRGFRFVTTGIESSARS
jgi:hypothetical protein